ncbi:MULTISPECIES: LCP family protein [Brevibacterium]|uniref:Cell envelope-related transcriptional attenuator n=4 Tax=Bacteria TaxID=2 RepID=K9AJR9_9MICO|nr:MULTISPECIES: LCP family protein [Brevibacterium]NJE67752.1 LytR family transcriptional regulator [Brevibacterium sp. LS14]NNV08198.1 LytR family transcriptional regulator [Geobacillus sp. MMMUD3]SII62501.1 transcriptional attenuator, LytR family [Mycobacteroides abscessus subsp. abscessus]EKU47534.1 cell envelope-related transcriptional attenuator [Brevibacterium casei S18]KZE17204.1 transcriptional regulator [Brevibacterium casei]
MTDNNPFDDIFTNDNDSEESRRPRRKKKRVWRKVLVGVLVVVVLGVLGVGVYLWNVGRSFDDNANQLSDEQVFGSQRPEAKNEEGGTNILLLGSDEPMKDVDVNSSRGLRSDSILVMHLPENGSNVQIMSIPRDSWVDIEGQGKAKINAALSYGGLPLAVKTVSDFIGTPIDHVAIIDFEGFKGLTDSLGGVRVNSEQAFTQNGYTFEKGENLLNGDEALTFVRERKSFKDGDFQRARNQQAFIKGLINELISADTLSNPAKIQEMVTEFAPYMYVDSGLNAQYISSTAFAMRDVRPGDIEFFTSPTAGVGRSADGQSIVNVDQDELKKLQDAFKNDTVDEYVKSAPEAHL